MLRQSLGADMKRRKFIALLGSVTAAWPVAARAQQFGRVRQIVIWMGRGNDAEGLRQATAFREGLQALGWADGRNIRADYRWVTCPLQTEPRVDLALPI